MYRSSIWKFSYSAFSTFSCCVPFPWCAMTLRFAPLWSIIPDCLSSPAHITHLKSNAPHHLLGVLRKVRVAHVVSRVRTPPPPRLSQVRRSQRLLILGYVH
mmetsp:Transcript_133918/g.428003  ORF Transcript_133918/g.428003 Transcript_133918/m.428003 type:complete len:101 (-) Transcript_133918:178-480(-)